MNKAYQEFGEQKVITSGLKFLLISLIVLQGFGLINSVMAINGAISPVSEEQAVLSPLWLVLLTIAGRVMCLVGGFIMLKKQTLGGFNLYLSGKLLAAYLPILMQIIYFEEYVIFLSFSLETMNFSTAEVPVRSVAGMSVCIDILLRSVWPMLIFMRRKELH